VQPSTKKLGFLVKDRFPFLQAEFKKLSHGVLIGFRPRTMRIVSVKTWLQVCQPEVHKTTGQQIFFCGFTVLSEKLCDCTIPDGWSSIAHQPSQRRIRLHVPYQLSPFPSALDISHIADIKAKFEYSYVHPIAKLSTISFLFSEENANVSWQYVDVIIQV